ncbi:MAG: signal peptidase II [Chloroflexi bacterium]|nr:MAG: signal peptidase II [Chloroflexota bacterium]
MRSTACPLRSPSSAPPEHDRRGARCRDNLAAGGQFSVAGAALPRPGRARRGGGSADQTPGRRSSRAQRGSVYLRLTYVQNRGAAFGLLQDQTAFFVFVGVLVIGVIAASYRYLPRSGFRLHLALGLQLGGAIGNLIDRIRQGYVVDFVDFGYHSNWWPVFNVADSAIVIGVALLALNALSPRASEESARAGDARG